MSEQHRIPEGTIIHAIMLNPGAERDRRMVESMVRYELWNGTYTAVDGRYTLADAKRVLSAIRYPTEWHTPSGFERAEDHLAEIDAAAGGA